ncbi:MAG: 30S ribosomal protein S16 [Bacteroidia bacterium]|nr:30S ribosomal protein S16 [Bacteroidia bacterium]
MPVKIRLQRHGKKAFAYFHIVVADGRAPRDGKFIEKIGTYNPNTNPATIELETNKALSWLESGAQPTDTCKAILSYKGVMFKHHLNKGVKKGALTQEQADARHAKWLQEKESRILGKVTKIAEARKEVNKKRYESEIAANSSRAAKLAAKKAAATETAETAAPAAETNTAPAAEESTPQ